MPRVAPSFSQAWHLSRLPAVAKIAPAPKARASWIAAVPIPLEPPWMSMASPGRSLPRSNTLCHTVKKVSGSAAASTMLKPLGTGRHCGAGATQ